MWKGIPIVASNTGGIKETIVNGQTGLLVDTIDMRSALVAIRLGDQYQPDEALIERFTGALLLVLQDTSLRERLTLNARRAIDHRGTVADNALALQELYHTLTSRA
jgi:glycosyltransferase involved in cell wall biosynthesis